MPPMRTINVIDQLPHRAPFRFVSEITSLEPGVRGTATWEITGEEKFFAGHFPDQPIVPGVLLAEGLAQLAGLVGFSESTHGGEAVRNAARLAHVDVKFGHAIAPPVVISLSAALVRKMADLMLFDVKALAGSKMAATGRLSLVVSGDREEDGSP